MACDPNGLTDINVTYQAERTSQLVPPQPVPPHNPPPTWRGFSTGPSGELWGAALQLAQHAGVVDQAAVAELVHQGLLRLPGGARWVRCAAVGPVRRGGPKGGRHHPGSRQLPPIFFVWFQRGKKRRPNETLGSVLEKCKEQRTHPGPGL